MVFSDNRRHGERGDVMADVDHLNRVRDALDDFLDACAEAEKTGDPVHVVLAGRLYCRFIRIRDARR